MLKKTNYYHLLLCYCFALFVSCKNKEVNNPLEYIRYVENESNGLLMKKNTGHYTFRLQYKPTAYMVLMDNQNLPVDPEGFLREELEYGESEYYTLRININDTLENPDIFTYSIYSDEQYDSLLKYFETDMKNDIRLITGTDTSIATSIQYEKENDRGECNNFFISFPATANSMDRTFLFNDRLLKTGMIRFTIEAKSISNAPELKL